MTEIGDAVRAALASAGDADRAVQQQRYMKSTMPFHGITSPQLRALLKPLFAGHELPSRDTWEDAVLDLWDHATHREQRYAATALAGHRAYRRWQDADPLPLHRHLVVTGAWWDHVDDVAIHQVGPVLRADATTVAPVVRAWADDDDLWLRRTAIICQVGAKAALDDQLLLDCIEPNLDDRELFIRKAIGWALRQHARLEPAWVQHVVASYGDRLSGLSRREALKHVGA